MPTRALRYTISCGRSPHDLSFHFCFSSSPARSWRPTAPGPGLLRRQHHRRLRPGKAGQAYPDSLQRDLDHLGYHYKVINQGTSGATTKDAVATCTSILRLHPEVVIVEFGGNDGLRGLPPDQTRRNLDTVLTTLTTRHIKMLLAGITLPPNYGADYIHAFEQIFRDLAARHHTAFVPMIYKDLVHVPGTIQHDGIHPTAKGAEIIADTLLPALKPLLQDS